MALGGDCDFEISLARIAGIDRELHGPADRSLGHRSDQTFLASYDLATNGVPCNNSCCRNLFELLHRLDSYVNAVSIVVDVDNVPTDFSWRELGGEAQMNVACHSHRQFTVGTEDADSQFCGSATRNLRERERRGCTVLETCSHALAF